MKFRVGQIVKLIDNSNIGAKLGATAIVRGVDSEFLSVEWKRNSFAKFQAHGKYFTRHFKPAVKKNEQLVFSFMEE